MTDKSKKLSRWYFGGISSAAAACVTHPLDLLKVLFTFLSHYISDLLVKNICNIHLYQSV